MMAIYKGQRIPLTVAFTDNSGVVDISGGSVTFDYWLPTNPNETPSGSISGTIVSPTLGTATGDIPESIDTESGTNWRAQAVLTLGSDTWKAKTSTFSVLNGGE